MQLNLWASKSPALQLHCNITETVMLVTSTSGKEAWFPFAEETEGSQGQA